MPSERRGWKTGVGPHQHAYLPWGRHCVIGNDDGPMLGGRDDLHRHVLEEVADRHAQDLGQPVQPRGTDAVGAPLALLDLLEA